LKSKQVLIICRRFYVLLQLSQQASALEEQIGLIRIRGQRQREKFESAVGSGFGPSGGVQFTAVLGGFKVKQALW
jgi:hypothetical protein